MKFLLYLNNIRISSGGPPRVASVVAAGLIERGHSVKVISKDKNHEDEYLFPDAVQIIRITYSSLNSIKILISEIKAADAVIVSGIWGLFEGFLLRIIWPKNANIFIRTCGMLEPYILKRSPLKKKIAWNCYVRENLSKASALLPNTSIEIKNLKNLKINNEFYVIPNGVKLPSIHDHFDKKDALKILGLQDEAEKSVVLFMSRLHPKKGIDLLITAFTAFSRRNARWIMIVAGPIEDEKYVKEMISSMPPNVAEKVHFVGEVHTIKKAACFSVASFFVLPSHSEGFPNVVIEALSWGLPSLITPGCNFPELHQSGAGIEVELDIDEIHDGLFKMADPQFLSQARPKAIELAAKYNLNVVIDKYESLGNFK